MKETKLSKAQITVLSNLVAGYGLVTSPTFYNTFWSPNARPVPDFILPATARKLHSLGLIMRKTGRKYDLDAWKANTFITKAGRAALIGDRKHRKPHSEKPVNVLGDGVWTYEVVFKD